MGRPGGKGVGCQSRGRWVDESSKHKNAGASLSVAAPCPLLPAGLSVDCCHHPIAHVASMVVGQGRGVGMSYSGVPARAAGRMASSPDARASRQHGSGGNKGACLGQLQVTYALCLQRLRRERACWSVRWSQRGRLRTPCTAVLHRRETQTG
jgi:hypothetical protein